jgi:hypothetical protein
MAPSKAHNRRTIDIEVVRQASGSGPRKHEKHEIIQIRSGCRLLRQAKAAGHDSLEFDGDGKLRFVVFVISWQRTAT